MTYWLAPVLVVIATTSYHVSQKLVAPNAHPIVSVIATFSMAALASCCLLPFFQLEGSFWAEVKKLNFASYAVGFTIVGIEIGVLLMYRSGWNISVGSVFTYSVITLLLLPIGIFFFKEQFSLTKLAGIVCALLAVYLLARK